jgi:hypothetical protein
MGNTCGVLSLTLAVVACDAVDRKQTALTPDCFGTDSSIAVTATHAGSLPLHLTVHELRSRCHNVRDTTVAGFEALDTAIVISRPDFIAIGVIATVENDEGHHVVRFDSSTRARAWRISGRATALPGNIPLHSTWAVMRDAYGELEPNALNSEIYVPICRGKELGLIFTYTGDAPINGQTEAQLDAVLANVRAVALSLPQPPRPC